MPTDTMKLERLTKIANQLEPGFTRVAFDGTKSTPLVVATGHQRGKFGREHHHPGQRVISRNILAVIRGGKLVSPGKDRTPQQYKEIIWDRRTHQVISFELDLDT